MIHYYDVDIAAEYGIEEAIMFQNIASWVVVNAANNRNFYDGAYWMYNSSTALLELMPEFRNIDAIKRILSRLVDKGLIIKGNYNHSKMDRTLWYSLTDRGLELSNRVKCTSELSIVRKCTMESAKMHNGKCENAQPIPYNKPYNKTDNNNTPYNSPKGEIESVSVGSLNSQTENVEEVQEEEMQFEAFRKMYRGTKRGLQTEFSHFKKKHKDWKQIVGSLAAIYERQCSARDNARANGCFVPQEKNLQTYLNQRCWEDELSFQPMKQKNKEVSDWGNPEEFASFIAEYQEVKKQW